ncbi:MAG: transporter, partial [Bacteroidales bacterium]|nr:transporter [Bacteroidales bacterium]
MSKIEKFVRDWMLPLGMATGAAMYLIYAEMDFLHPAGPYLLHAMGIIQPLLLFTMLFLTFCKIEPRQMKPHRWHWWLLLIQVGSYAAMGTVLALLPDSRYDVIVEAAMICMICPTATAAAVVTDKLGGDIAGIITYTVLINIATAIVVPVFVPLLHPSDGKTFLEAFWLILAKVFPLLICPCLLAWMVRYMAPHLHRKIVRFKDLAFYIWAVSLTLAILMTTRSLVHSGTTLPILTAMGLATLLTCILQFALGKKIGARYNHKITAGQALGQKNTVFAIWMGYTFMEPVTAVAGGFYSIWHNCFNSWQLYRKRKSGE